jgi:hypothetical protein
MLEKQQNPSKYIRNILKMTLQKAWKKPGYRIEGNRVNR